MINHGDVIKKDAKAYNTLSSLSLSVADDNTGWFLRAADKKPSDSGFNWNESIIVLLSPPEGLAFAAFLLGNTPVLWDMNGGKPTGFFHRPGHSDAKMVVGMNNGTFSQIQVKRKDRSGHIRKVDISVCPTHRLEMGFYIYTTAHHIAMFQGMSSGDIKNIADSMFGSFPSVQNK